MIAEPISTLPVGVEHAAHSEAKILLIDLENCPSQIQQLQDDLNDYTKVVICYAKSGAKIPLDWLLALNETINSNRLQVYKMQTAGKNSADFGMCFYAGMLAQQLGEGADFTIVSDDTDLDHLVSLLNSQHHTAQRQGKLKAVKASRATGAEVTPQVMAGVRVYCEYLATPNASRPGSAASLKNSIRSHMQHNTEVSEAVFSQLLNLKVVSLNETKTVYNNAKIGAVVNGSSLNVKQA